MKFGHDGTIEVSKRKVFWYTLDCMQGKVFTGVFTPYGRRVNYRLFVPKTFPSQERKVPIENFRSPGTKVARNFRSPGTKVPENERARERKFQGTFVPRERKFPGTKGPGNESSWQLSFLGNESSL